MKEIGNAGVQETGRWLNNRAENSHQPFRRRERAMLRFRRMHTLQKFSSVHASVHNHFNHERHLVSRDIYKARRSAALAAWQAVVGLSPGPVWRSCAHRRQVTVRLTASIRGLHQGQQPGGAAQTGRTHGCSRPVLIAAQNLLRRGSRPHMVQRPHHRTATPMQGPSTASRIRPTAPAWAFNGFPKPNRFQ